MSSGRSPPKPLRVCSDNLDAEEARLFRSGLGIALYVSQERCDIQHIVRILATYMAKPTRTSICALKKLTNYLIYCKDMKLHYPQVEMHQSTGQRWYGGEERCDSKQYLLELYSDSDWASCKVSRRSTSSGLIFLNSCLIHSHSRSQTSVSLSSMEAEILAATSLLTEGIYVKQVLQFLVGDTGGLGNQEKIMMRLRLDSTSAQAFFSRLGPGKAKHLSTRLLWTQQAMRRLWFHIDRISTKENPADLNTKPLSKGRREFLMKRIGLQSSNFEMDENIPQNNRKKQLVKLLVNMVMANNLQGCQEGERTLEFSWSLTLAMMVIFLLLMLVARLFFKLTKKMEELEKYKAVWKTVREAAHLQREQDPFLCELDGNQHRDEEAEEEHLLVMDNETTSEKQMNGTLETMMPEGDGADQMEEMNLRRHRILRSDAEHGAAAGDGSDVPRDDGHGDEHGRPDDEDEDFEEETESPRTRHQRYLQSSMDEVSDVEDWSNIHYGYAV